MTETLYIIEKSELPNQLKEYFNGSKKIQRLITKELIEDIEDLYLYYRSLYNFELTEFGIYVVDSLIKCKDYSSYYFYLKKILENHLAVELKDENNSVNINMNLITEEINNSASDIINLLSIESDEKINQINFHLGKLELINKLIVDDDYIDLYHNILQLKNNYYCKKDNQLEEQL